MDGLFIILVVYLWRNDIKEWLIDYDTWEEIEERETEAEETLRAVYDNWSDVRDLLDNVND